MTSDTPNHDSGKAWKQAASRPPPRRAMLYVIAIGVAAAVGLVGWMVWATFGGLAHAGGDAEAFAGAAVAKIAAQWDDAEIAAIATPALASSLKSGTPLAERYRILGALVSVGKCSTYRLNITNGAGDAEVRCDAEFASAKAT